MDLKNYVTINADGKAEFDEAKFNADLDRERTTASNTSASNTEKKLRADIEKELRAKIAEEEKLSAEEKLNKAKADFETEKRTYYKERIKSIYTAGGYTDDEAEVLCGAINTADFNASIESANKLVEARKKVNEDARQTILKEIQNNQGKASGGTGGESISEAVRRARERNAENGLS